MQEQDAVLADIIREMREERGRRGGFDDSRLRERVEVLGPEVSLDLLRDAVSTAIVDQLGVTWDERYGELKRYKDEHGDCDVPPRWAENPAIRRMGVHPALATKQGALTADRKNRLMRLVSFGMPRGCLGDHVCRTEALQARARRLQRPPTMGRNPKLASWVSRQRQFKRE